MPVYSQEVVIYATVYVRADDKETARAAIAKYCGDDGREVDVRGDDIDGRSFDCLEPGNPKLSPAMTLSPSESQPDSVEYFDN